jgi:hypothetical protein
MQFTPLPEMIACPSVVVVIFFKDTALRLHPPTTAVRFKGRKRKWGSGLSLLSWLFDVLLAFLSHRCRGVHVNGPVDKRFRSF